MTLDLTLSDCTSKNLLMNERPWMIQPDGYFCAKHKIARISYISSSAPPSILSTATTIPPEEIHKTSPTPDPQGTYENTQDLQDLLAYLQEEKDQGTLAKRHLNNKQAQE
ncbi:hypothetical protein HYALB_00009728 [Hymenoscyphus albidus]|uniref:Uncharacterized protein n=1 Tax=Hymenoscyphus albidus TaxID=595503 RepID=A0A9N9LF58_9HELO|nr:hypothetical protein HYALB_00009728 [Hymenoscyphus albidus]